MQPTLLLLAAGMGSRYGGLKQLDAMGPHGQTMIDYAVDDAIRSGFGQVVFVIRRDFEAAFRSQIGAHYEDRFDVRYAFQELNDLPGAHTPPDGRSKPWGTAHAVRAARNCITEPFAVINADDFYGRPAYAQMAKQLQSFAESDRDQTAAPVGLAMVGYTLARTLSPYGSVNRGICQIKHGELRSVEEFTGIAIDHDGQLRGDNAQGERVALPREAIVSMNFWGFTPAIFAPLERQFEAFLQERGGEPTSEYYLPTLVDSLIRDEAIKCPVLPTESNWFGVTYPEDKARVVEALQRLAEDDS